MIKVDKHPLVCDCEHCRDLFPADRFEAVWNVPDPGVPGALRTIGRIPIGHPRAPLQFGLWVEPTGEDDLHRLLHDWPGFPGTAGAIVKLTPPIPNAPRAIAGTVDPILRALSTEVPLRRRFATRLSPRCMVEFGLAEPDVTDLIACERHGHGLPALTCEHVLTSESPLDTALLYGVDGDYPDLLCTACLERYAAGDLDVCVTVCSRCLQPLVYRHRLVATTHYGAGSG